MDAGLLDVLHDGGDPGVVAVAEGVDVDLDRAFEEAVDERRPLDPRHRLADVLGGVADAHGAAAEHMRGAHEHRVADPLGDVDGGVGVAGDAPVGTADLEAVAEGREALAVLGQVDGVVRGAEDRVAGRGEHGRELERRLAAELDGDPGRALAFADGEHLLGAERLEVEPVGGVVVGRDRLGVAVDHHGLVAERAEATGRRGRSSSRTRCPARSGSARSRG